MISLADTLLDLRVGNAIDVLREIPDGSINMCVTSPPYYALRDYETPEVEFEDGWKGQLGQEDTPELFVAHLMMIFREVKRVLRDDGSFWLNIGDSYASTSTKGGWRDKELIGVPWMISSAMRAEGWWTRSENIWNKIGAMPESVLDRTTRSHEHVFHFTKKARYFYDTDAVREPYTEPLNRWGGPKVTAEGQENSPRGLDRDRDLRPHPDGKIRRSVWNMATANYPGAHFAVFPIELPELCIKATTSERGRCPLCGSPWKRMVESEGETVEQRKARQPKKNHSLQIAPRPDGGALQQGIHIGNGERKTIGWEPTCDHVDESVTNLVGEHPPLEPEPCVVLDPFVGSGTTMVIARRLGRRSIGIELSETYAREETMRRLATWWRDMFRARPQPDGQESLFGGQVLFE